MREFDLKSPPIIEILDDIVNSDRRILSLYLYRLLVRQFSNVITDKQQLNIDGFKCVIRADSSDFFPSYTKGHGRKKTQEAQDSFLKKVDYFLVYEQADNLIAFETVRVKDNEQNLVSPRRKRSGLHT